MTYDMDTVIEASSLSTITTIASNPPQHPSIPTQHPGQPLVLYIARVPGSRDVFLTPMKPREKVVTAEDVQSSLYYVHINCDEDRESLQSDESPYPASPNVSHVAPVQGQVKRMRPPLPDRPQPPISPPYPVYDQMPDTRNRTRSPRKTGNVSRKPVGAANEQPPPLPPHLDLPEIPSRRPLPTPPDEQPRRTSLHDENMRLLRHSEHSDETNPYFRKYDPPQQPTSETAPSTAGSLTLIRRNPASNEQWNVASIHDPPVHEVSSSALLTPGSARRTKRGGAPLYLDITNPGYSQFIDKDRPESRISTSSHSSGSSNDPPPEGIFRRRLYMPGSRYGEHGYSHRSKVNSVDFTASSSEAMQQQNARSRALSDLTANSPRVDKRSKGYAFTSPWEGRCEFSTGATGKSLKCRHTVPHSFPVEVSELRFNLPTSSRHNTPTPTNAEKRSSYFSRHSKLLSGNGSGDFDDGSSTPSIIIGEDGRVDLTLGQEKAGGGFGGKQAKLGKLIVAREGLGMLDLLVAANVGLWWRAYERGV